MRYLVFLSLVLSSLSCVKEIEVNHPQTESKLTLNCVIRQGYPIRASLSSTLPFNNPGYSPYYKDGLVVLYENGLPVDTMEICEKEYLERSNDTIWYYCSSHTTSVGATYSVEASRKGFPRIVGMAKMPAKPRIVSIESTEDNEFGDVYEILIEDPDPDKNFYIVQMRSTDEFGNAITTQLSTADPTINIYQSYIAFQLPIDEISGSTAYFSERYFVNQRRVVKLRATLNDLSSANEVLLISASKDYHNYRKAIDINSAVGENPFTEPVRMKSNVNGGFGIVGCEHINLFKF